MKGESMGEVVSIHIVRQRHGVVEAVERATVANELWSAGGLAVTSES